MLVGTLALAQALEIAQRPAPLPERSAVGLGVPLGTRVGVEHVELALLGEQRLVVVGAVEVDQVLPERFQHRQRAWRTVDELFVATAGADDAADDELLVLARVEPRLLEHRVDLGRLLQIEYRLDRAAALAAAHQPAVGALAEHEFQCSDDDRFPRSRLAGDADEAAAEIPGQFFDQGEVLDFQEREH